LQNRIESSVNSLQLGHCAGLIPPCNKRGVLFMIDRKSNTAVVIVTFNASEWINRCVESVFSQSISGLHLIVIDNNSQDDTIKKLGMYGENVTVLHSPGNIGFGRANNIGFEKAIELGCEYCFLLNQDAWIEPGCIASLIDVAECDTNMGILSPLQCSYDSKLLHRGFQSYLPLHAKKLIPEEAFEVNFVQAALWLIPVRVLLDVGGFDPVFFMYGEDDDLAGRIRNSGRLIVVIPNAVGHHRESLGLPSIKRQAARYFTDTVALLRYSYHPLWRRYLIVASGAFRSFAKLMCVFKFRKCISLLLSHWWVLTRFYQIEKSRKALMSSSSPFLGAR